MQGEVVYQTEQCGEGCCLALKNADTGLVSQNQCRRDLRKVGFGVVKIKSKSHLLKEGAFFCCLRVCSTGFHDLIREKPSYLFMLLR